jgi:glycosyltransferase involved in cell wall biosynthesis
MTSPLFSVVMPAYNAERTIGDAIHSTLGQTIDDFELIVVDDGSTDNTAENVMLFRDPRIQLVRQANGGLAAARNTGLGRARGVYASFFDADDLLLPTFLETTKATFDRFPHAGIVDCEHWLLDDPTGRMHAPIRSGPDLRPDDPAQLLRALLKENLIWGTASVPMSVIGEVGGFDPRLRACEDYELWLRIVARGRRVACAPGRLVVWRRTGSTLSTDSAVMTRFLCEVYGFVVNEYDVPDDVRALARARRATCERHLAALTGDRRVAGARLRLRGRLGRIKRAVWHPRGPVEIPPEVATAFPQLVRMCGRSSLRQHGG